MLQYIITSDLQNKLRHSLANDNRVHLSMSNEMANIFFGMATQDLPTQ